MLQALDINQKTSPILWNRTNQLEKITYTVFQYAGFGRYSDRLQRFLSFVIRCIEEGSSGLALTYAQIVRAQKDAGQKKSSKSTLKLQLKEAEAAGFMLRQTFKIGPRRNKTIIHFRLDKFAFWLTPRCHIAPVNPNYINAELSQSRRSDNTEYTYTDPQGQKLTGDIVTREDPKSLPVSLSSVTEPARARTSKGEHFKNNIEKGKGERKREHPVVYSVKKATEGQGKKRRLALIALARLEAENPKKRFSGAPWEKWTGRNQKNGRLVFEELGIPHERESVVLEQFLPYFEIMLGLEKIEPAIKAILRRGKKPIPPEQLQAEQLEIERRKKEAVQPDPEPNQPTQDDIRSFLKSAGLQSQLDKVQPEDLKPVSPEEVKAMLREAGLDEALRIDPGSSQDEGQKSTILSGDDLDILNRAKLQVARATGCR